MATLLASSFCARVGRDGTSRRDLAHNPMPELWRRASAHVGWSVRSWLGLRSGDLARSNSTTADKLRTELAAIRSYAAFVRSHPGMPLEHRNHCLDSIVSECADLEKAMNEMIESASRMTRYN